MRGLRILGTAGKGIWTGSSDQARAVLESVGLMVPVSLRASEK